MPTTLTRPPVDSPPVATAHEAESTQPTTAAPHSWDTNACRDLVAELLALRQALLANEAAHADTLAHLPPSQRASARNWLHYLCLRQHDHRGLQERLASLGLSSLGRAESHVLANLDKVLGLLHALTGQAWHDRSADEPAGLHSGQRLLERHTLALLGTAPLKRAVRIMVTLPSEAATQPEAVLRMVEAGMDVARINCAHDGPAAWEAMVAHVRQAERQVGRPVRVLMDLGGPKLRTGPLPPGPQVLKLRPERDALGRVVTPATLGLRAHGATRPVPGVCAQVGVKADWLAGLELGDEIELIDARDAHRRLRVVALRPEGAVVESDHTVYLVPQTRLTRQRHGRHAPVNTRLSGLPTLPGRVWLRPGDRLRVVSPDALSLSGGREPPSDSLQRIACTLPEVFDQVQVGERVWFDDGRVGGVVRAADPEGWVVEITHAREAGEKLTADKGINLPDSHLPLPAITPKDADDLRAVARLADAVGLSFVQTPQDVQELLVRLQGLGAGHLGIVLKIETRRAFENLPALMLAALAAPASGLMIARGDLAVECGHERLAEIQEELLWAAEAAHMPVIWATQVLETLAKTGLPSRAEITDAAMGNRAECVMLNKGPHILEAIRTLDGILLRMQAHQHKKRSLLRALGAWR